MISDMFSVFYDICQSCERTKYAVPGYFLHISASYWGMRANKALILPLI